MDLLYFPCLINKIETNKTKITKKILLLFHNKNKSFVGYKYTNIKPNSNVIKKTNRLIINY